MMNETILSRSLRLMFSGGVAVGLGFIAQPALAQDAPADAPIQRVEITGSSILRVAKEGALPVQVLSQDDIKKTGATSVTDLIQLLPVMQGFVPASSSVNGGGAGVTTAALHGLPSKYTLVLVDGQRMAPQALGQGQGGGFAANISSIPLEAVERVEILTDGASALYGSDAIAGVVNFILKKKQTDLNVYATYNQPAHTGGKNFSAGISKGWGDVAKDGYNLLLSYSHDEQRELMAQQRGFSASGAYLPFSYQGKKYILDQRTQNTEPANISFTGKDAAGNVKNYTLNPYYAAHGDCGSPLAGPSSIAASATDAAGVKCNFNYAATVQDIPSSVRDSVLLKGALKLDDDTTVWSDLLFSRYAMKAQYAPSAQPLGIGPARIPALYNAYVAPYLAANGLSMVGPTATLNYRSVLTGGRDDKYVTEARHAAFGINGLVAGWNYNASATLSVSVQKDDSAGGYTDFDKFSGLIDSGQYDPVSGAGAGLLSSALLNGVQFSKTTSRLNTVHAGAQHDLWALPGGTSILSVGGDYTKTHFQQSYNDLLLSQSGFSTQPASTDYPIGGAYGAVPFDASRDNYGVFGEYLMPISKTLEATVSARYDSYDRVHSRDVFQTPEQAGGGVQNQLPDADLGNKLSSSTYKASFRWSPVQTVLFRGAYGTGFKAPDVTDLAGSTVFGNSTVGTYVCPFPGSPGCHAGAAQYDLLKSGNGQSGANGLKAEKSKQWTLGFRVEPLKGLSAGLDVWNVKIRNQVLSAGISEQVAFSHADQYKALFINPYPDPAGYTTIAYLQAPINGGVANYRGVDWDLSYRTDTPVGKLNTSWTGTYMLRQNYTLVPGGEVYSDLARFGADNNVVFRIQSRLNAALQTGKFTNALAANFKSKYKDQAYEAGNGVHAQNADGSLGDDVDFSGLEVASYITWDYQVKFDYSKALTLTAGVKNLFDRDPPLTLQNAGGGNQIGYDGRYADPLGRAFYLSGNYRF